MPILNNTLGSLPITSLIWGTRFQNFKRIDGLMVARVNATKGPRLWASVGSKGDVPLQFPREVMGFKKTVQLSSDLDR